MANEGGGEGAAAVRGLLYDEIRYTRDFRWTRSNAYENHYSIKENAFAKATASRTTRTAGELRQVKKIRRSSHARRLLVGNVPFKLPDDLTQLMLSANVQLLILLSEVFSLAQREMSFELVLDYKRLAAYTNQLSRKPTNSLNYVYGSLESVLCDSGPARTVVVRFFDSFSGLFKPTVYAPCALGHSYMLSKSVPVVSTLRSGHVNYNFMGTHSANVSFEELLRAVLALLESHCQQQVVTGGKF